jgi:hypothetical protein
VSGGADALRASSGYGINGALRRSEKENEEPRKEKRQEEREAQRGERKSNDARSK